ncbi:MAG: hypothetical protein QW303_04875 [Nitrososphaerota archaeon]
MEVKLGESTLPSCTNEGLTGAHVITYRNDGTKMVIDIWIVPMCRTHNTKSSTECFTFKDGTIGLLISCYPSMTKEQYDDYLYLNGHS